MTVYVREFTNEVDSNNVRLIYIFSQISYQRLPAKTKLISSENRRLPFQIFWMNTLSAFAQDLFMLLQHRIVEANDVLSLVMFEQLQSHTPDITLLLAVESTRRNIKLAYS